MDTGCDRCGCCVSGAEEYGIIYDVVNMNREMFMGCVARMPRVRYSVAYPHGARAYRESDSFAMWAVHHGVTVSMTTVSISSDPFTPKYL